MSNYFASMILCMYHYICLKIISIFIEFLSSNNQLKNAYDILNNQLDPCASIISLDMCLYNITHYILYDLLFYRFLSLNY